MTIKIKLTKNLKELINFIKNIIMVLVLKKGASKKEINQIKKKLLNAEGVNTRIFCGLIKLKEDPLTVQKSLRDEWK
jgi:hypothetical protein